MNLTFDRIKRFMGMRGVEDCVQCGAEGPFTMIAVMQKGGQALFRVGRFAAFPICPRCHAAPRVKAHFNSRQNIERAVSCAGSSNLSF